MICKKKKKIGINTGYFDDITEYQEIIQMKCAEDDFNIDFNVSENEFYYDKEKNYNCGIDISHIIF